MTRVESTVPPTNPHQMADDIIISGDESGAEGDGDEEPEQDQGDEDENDSR